jgi:NAD(P)-dependent dehydrogenase (short-subunit alcohol dehydrogenase family)
MAGRLAGKCCLVTGAAQGIGRHIATAFLREEARVVATDFNREGLRDLACARRVEALHLDVTDFSAAQALAADHGDVSVLVNCAGYVAVGSALECTHGEFAASMDVNVRSIFNMVRAFLPPMIERREGSIINIASVVSSRKAAPQRFAYSASKAAVLAMTRSIALDYISQGVRCNSISPGTVDTPSLAARLSESDGSMASRQAMIARQPLGRLGRPEEIAEVAVLLAADEAKFMTGADIVIDGGMSL